MNKKCVVFLLVGLIISLFGQTGEEFLSISPVSSKPYRQFYMVFQADQWNIGLNQLWRKSIKQTAFIELEKKGSLFSVYWIIGKDNSLKRVKIGTSESASRKSIKDVIENFLYSKSEVLELNIINDSFGNKVPIKPNHNIEEIKDMQFR